MNVNDVKEVKKAEGDMLEGIFEKQKALMEKYHHIEKASGLLQTPDCPVNLHDSKGQARLKDFAWRVTEELTEATDCFISDIVHFKEELIDALHFFVELCILTDGFPRKQDQFDHLEKLFLDNLGLESMADVHIKIDVYNVIQQIGNAMNCLKNKPWKQSQMQTDVKKYSNHIDAALNQFIRLFIKAEMTALEVYEMYVKKNEVNKFRQRSKY